MRGYFEDEQEEREVRRRDTELTLGAGAILGIIFCLLALCGLCFWLGYRVGFRNSSAIAAAPQSPAQTAAPDQEPLQASDNIPKPSADEQSPAEAPATSDGAAAPTGNSGANPAGQQNPAPAATPPSAPAPAAPAQQQTQPPVRPALPAANATQSGQTASAPNVHPALPGATTYMVQVAAVSHQEDADVLVGALRRRGYPATEMHDTSDGLIHVRIGPFTSRDDATRMCTKLLNDGYNAMIEP